jgi:hypothetical protein
VLGLDALQLRKNDFERLVPGHFDEGLGTTPDTAGLPSFRVAEMQIGGK